MIQPPPQIRSRAFTLVEVMVATAITAMLFIMMSGMWRGLARSMNHSLVDARISQEAHFILEVMRRDLGGFLPGKETEQEDENKLVGRLATAAKQLMLCFDDDHADGEPDWGKPDTVIVYEVRDGQLLRIEQTDKGKFIVVASHLTDFTPTQLAKGVRVDFTITYEGFSKTYSLISQDP
jgi:prepilin-type N-terminal cleavage/methylation domain-containing protein